MAINYFIGWTQSELEEELAAAQEDLAAGKATIMAQAGEARSGRAVEESAVNRIKMLLRALNAVNPTAYPADQVTAMTSTRAAFA